MGGVKRRTSTAHRSRRSIRRSDETLLANGARIGRAERWRSRSRRVLGQASLSANGSCPLAGSLARGRVDFTRRASTQAKSRTSRRGVESAKFGRATACLRTERAGTERSGARIQVRSQTEIQRRQSVVFGGSEAKRKNQSLPPPQKM
jgi:hypothetical protein